MFAAIARYSILGALCSCHVESLAVEPWFSSSHGPNGAIMNFSEAGLCYAAGRGVAPLQRAVEDNWERIRTNVERGRQQAENMRVIFAGLIRNAEESVFRSYAMLKRLGRQFRDYHFILFENDSTDDTAKAMKEIAQRDSKYEFQTEVLSMGDERGLEASRMERMATLRNKVHDLVDAFVRRSPGWDLLVMYDFDLNLIGPDVLSPHVFFGALGRQESLDNGWDMLCANGLARSCGPPTCKYGMHDVIAFRGRHNSSWSFDIASVMFDQYELVPVDSCFGGLAMYKIDKFLGCRYDPEVNECEHVGLHRCMRERGSDGRMFMDPLMTPSYDMFLDLKCTADASRARSP
ncbi:unnamed protein product [Prorocentrum cordatum]|uniref:Hexosyltransferase n=1 Tax=Prorocentrum cordatum TaxID=2364126 RepID=A0ABN9QW76_9DINO|nr:unnamed protein product [Polarella glacialis]